MKLSLFIKTFFILLLSFSAVFFLSNLYLYYQFNHKYVETNIDTVKDAILSSAPELENNSALDSTLLREVSSETQFIRFKNNVATEMIGPDILKEEDILMFVINIYDDEKIITEGNISYTIEITDDIYHISYIYRFGSSDYLLVLKKIQSLRNISKVLDDVTYTQGVFLLIMIILISLVISNHVTSPIKKINLYAKKIAQLDFTQDLILHRSDEFKQLITSLNEMAFNLKKAYKDLELANQQLSDDIEFEKQQETKKKQLILTINHELRTPVAVIKGMVEGMLENVGRFKDRETYLNEVLKQIEDIDRMTKDLTYSLKLEDLAKPNDLTNLQSVEENIKNVLELAEIKKVKVDIDLLPANVRMNQELLGILISNLLKNAINYTENQHVKLTTSEDNLYIYIEIRNQGFIKEEDLEKIFKPYFRIQSTIEGSGLGLYIVSQICGIYQADYKVFNDNGFVVAKITLKKG